MPYERYWTVISTRRRCDLPMGQIDAQPSRVLHALFPPWNRPNGSRVVNRTRTTANVSTGWRGLVFTRR